MKTPTRVGDLVAGRYRIKELIGKGGMGSVYLAEHEALQRNFAVKVLAHRLANDERLRRRFQREARAASRVQHPNIVFISDFGTMEDGCLFLVMEHIAGRTLREELVTTGAMPLKRALKVLVQITDALDCAHRAEVVHRDLKPENLLLTEHRGKPDFVKVLDFGVAKIIDPRYAEGAELSAAGELYGTPQYMAPEQFAGQPVGPHTDIYALGAVAYEMVTGKPPFTGGVAELMVAHARKAPPQPSAKSPKADVSPAFDAIVARCLAKRPGERYASAAELKASLTSLYRVTCGRSQPAQLPDDTEMSSPLRQFALLAGLAASDDDVTVDRSHSPTLAGDGGGLFERTLRDLAEALRDHDRGTHELTVALTRLTQAEDRIFGAQAEIALSEAQIAEVDQSIDDRAGRLRYAVLQARAERSRLTDPAAARSAPTVIGHAVDPVAALDREIAELERRLYQLEAERGERVAALEHRLSSQRTALEKYEAGYHEHLVQLDTLVKDARSTADIPDLLTLYERLDHLRHLPASRPR